MKNEMKSFTIHTGRFLDEIIKGSNMDIYRIPLSILKRLLVRVGERSSRLNDPILNKLMCDLTIYSIADPYSEDYNPKIVSEIQLKAKIKE